MGFLDSVFGRSKGAGSAKASDDDLFDDEFQRKLDYLALMSKRVFAGRMRAERRTKKSGSGVESGRAAEEGNSTAGKCSGAGSSARSSPAPRKIVWQRCTWLWISPGRTS